jgi:hypothetical protein
MLFLLYAAGYTAWGKERGNRIRSHLGMRKFDWDIYRGRHQKELLSNFYIIKGQEYLIQEGHEVDGFMFEDRMS